MKFKNLFLMMLAIGLLLTARTALAQLGESEFLPPDQAFRVEASADGADKLRVDFLVTPGYYLYRHRMSFALDSSAGPVAATLEAAASDAGRWLVPCDPRSTATAAAPAGIAALAAVTERAVSALPGCGAVAGPDAPSSAPSPRSRRPPRLRRPRRRPSPSESSADG